MEVTPLVAAWGAALAVALLEGYHATAAVGLDLATAQEHRPQPSASALHAGLHARDRQPQLLCCGALRHTLQLRELYGLPVVLGELADHRGDAVGHLGACLGRRLAIYRIGGGFVRGLAGSCAVL